MFLSSLYSALMLLQGVFFCFGFVCNNNSFPQPLSSEEEINYLNLYQNGSEEARNILIERNLRLVAHIAKKYTVMGKDNDDIISIGTIGLIKAITTFNQNKGIRLATYAAKCIENEILMNMRLTKKLQNEVSLNDPIGTDKEGNDITLIDVIEADERTIFDEVDLKIQVKKLYNKMKDILKNREKIIIELRYGLLNGNSKTQKEIAQMLGISRSYVSRIEKKAIKKLSKELKVDNCL